MEETRSIAVFSKSRSSQLEMSFVSSQCNSLSRTDVLSSCLLKLKGQCSVEYPLQLLGPDRVEVEPVVERLVPTPRATAHSRRRLELLISEWCHWCSAV